MRVLIVEDDFISRKILNAFMAPYGVCDVAVNGQEALYAMQLAYREEHPYDLVCLDLAMPGMDGHETLRELRALEDRLGVQGLERAKVMMTTASHDHNDVRSAFHAQCDAYLVKPITKATLLEQLQDLGLLVGNAGQA